MTQQMQHTAVAVIGLVLLTDGKTIIDLGSIEKAVRNDSGMVELSIAGRGGCVRLSGPDAEGVWGALQQAAIPVDALIPVPSTFDLGNPPPTNPYQLPSDPGASPGPDISARGPFVTGPTGAALTDPLHAGPKVTVTPHETEGAKPQFPT